MFIARILFFRLHESPRYLVHAGRPQEALESLQMISRFNGSGAHYPTTLEDVEDHIYTTIDEPSSALSIPEDDDAHVAPPRLLTQTSSEALQSPGRSMPLDYSATAEGPEPGRSGEESDGLPQRPRLPARRWSEGNACRILPQTVRGPILRWWDRVQMVLTPEWRRTTFLVWGAWFFMSLGQCDLFITSYFIKR